jgi:hypothetical protein
MCILLHQPCLTLTVLELQWVPCVHPFCNVLVKKPLLVGVHTLPRGVCKKAPEDIGHDVVVAYPSVTRGYGIGYRFFQNRVWVFFKRGIDGGHACSSNIASNWYAIDLIWFSVAFPGFIFTWFGKLCRSDIVHTA